MKWLIIGLLLGGPMGYIVSALMQTASAEDDRSLAELVGLWKEEYTEIKCSKCGHEFSDEVTCCSMCYGWPWEYCPKCGSRMEVDEDA